MNENLAEMIKSQRSTPPIVNESDLHLQESVNKSIETEQTSNVAEPVIIEPRKDMIDITNLTDWFENNHTNFANISRVRLSLKGVDPIKTLVFTVSKDTDGERELEIFKDSNVHPMLNISGISMIVYKQGFGVIQYYKGEFECFIKSYIVRSGTYFTLCKNIGGVLIPYHMDKINKNTTQAEIIECVNNIESKLNLNVNKEILSILYKQSIKFMDKITTIQDTITWFFERQKTIEDVNHHLQIDNAIISLLK
jgi:hypothetical protein